MKVAVVTAIYGGYDQLHEPVPQSVDCEWVCITDDTMLTSDTWKIEPHPIGASHPRLRAKIPKFMPWMYADADTSIWVDGSAEIISPTFVEEAIAALGESSMAQFQHPWRDCIYDEAEASLGLPKYEGLPLSRQVEQYRTQGHPEHWGLWATGVIARNHDSDQRELGPAWLAECRTWTYQDQLSQAPVMRDLDIRPVELPYSLVSSPWLAWHQHASVL